MRWYFLGFRRVADLAAAVGCSYAAIHQWSGRENPPLVMHGGFDRKLADALRTSRMMLFGGYTSTSPQDAPIIGDDDHDGDLDARGHDRARHRSRQRAA